MKAAEAFQALLEILDLNPKAEPLKNCKLSFVYYQDCWIDLSAYIYALVNTPIMRVEGWYAEFLM